MNIYDLTYCVVRRRLDKRDGLETGEESFDIAPGVVFVVISLHFMVIISIIKYFIIPMDLSAIRISDNRGIDKALSMGILLLCSVIFKFFFYKRKRCLKLLNEFEQKYSKVKMRYLLIILLNLFVPIILMIPLNTI